MLLHRISFCCYPPSSPISLLPCCPSVIDKGHEVIGRTTTGNFCLVCMATALLISQLMMGPVMAGLAQTLLARTGMSLCSTTL